MADAKEIIERATYTMIQSVANTVESARRELAEQINGLSGMDETEIIVTEKDITIESVTVIDKSDTAAAVDGSLYSVSIISGSNKNIEEGDRVRCVEDE